MDFQGCPKCQPPLLSMCAHPTISLCTFQGLLGKLPNTRCTLHSPKHSDHSTAMPALPMPCPCLATALPLPCQLPCLCLALALRCPGTAPCYACQTLLLPICPPWHVTEGLPKVSLAICQANQYILQPLPCQCLCCCLAERQKRNTEKSNRGLLEE